MTLSYTCGFVHYLYVHKQKVAQFAIMGIAIHSELPFEVIALDLTMKVMYA